MSEFLFCKKSIVNMLEPQALEIFIKATSDNVACLKEQLSLWDYNVFVMALIGEKINLIKKLAPTNNNFEKLLTLNFTPCSSYELISKIAVECFQELRFFCCYCHVDDEFIDPCINEENELISVEFREHIGRFAREIYELSYYGEKGMLNEGEIRKVQAKIRVLIHRICAQCLTLHLEILDLAQSLPKNHERTRALEISRILSTEVKRFENEYDERWLSRAINFDL